MIVKQLCDFLEAKFPMALAAEFDKGKLGLQIGNPSSKIKNVLLTLDVTTEVVHEAIRRDANVIVSHHPCIFYPILEITDQTPTGEIIRLLIKNDIHVYNMHTNLDLSENGVNVVLANRLKLIHHRKASVERAEEAFLRIGEVKPQTLKEFAEHVKNVFGLMHVRVLGNLDRVVGRIGIIGGAGSDIEELNRAKKLRLRLLRHIRN